MTYREIRKFQPRGFKTDFIVCPYCYLFSPYFTKIFLNFNIAPNIVTVMMILSGLLGAILFAIPVLPFQICGALLIHIWFILDCSDGEVARITGNFSTFGREIDYTAHIINHPCFSVGFISAMYFSELYDMLWIIVLFFVFILLETMGRHLLSFYVIHDLKLPSSTNDVKIFPFWKKLAIYVMNSLTVYPCFALIFPILYFVDISFQLNTCVILLLIYAVANIIVIPRQVYRWVKRIVLE